MEVNDFLARTKDAEIYFLLDVSWISYRSYFVNQQLTTEIQGRDVPSGHVYGLLNSVMSIRRRYVEAPILLVRDGVRNVRKELNPDYKSTRADLPFNIHADIAEATSIAHRIPGVYSAYGTSLEADDVMFSMAKKVASRTDSRAIIYTGDADLFQAVEEKISLLRVWEPDRNKPLPELSFEHVSAEYGVDPEVLSIYRAVCGDKSDNLRGILRFSRPFLRHHLSRRRDISVFFDPVQNFSAYPTSEKTSKKCFEELLSNRELVEKNHLIMRLSEVGDDEFSIQRSENIEALKSLTRKWRLKSLENFLGAFEPQKVDMDDIVQVPI